MISQNRSYQIIQGVMSLLLGCISIALLVTLRHSEYPSVIPRYFSGSRGYPNLFRRLSSQPLQSPGYVRKTGISERYWFDRLWCALFQHRYVETTSAALVYCRVASLFRTDSGYGRGLAGIGIVLIAGRHLRYLSFIREAIIR